MNKASWVEINELKAGNDDDRRWTKNYMYNERVSTYEGNKWETKFQSSGPFIFDNGRWAENNFSSGKPLAVREYRLLFYSTWSESYDANGKVKPSGQTLGRLYQGNSGSGSFGNQRSLIGFGTRDIQSKIRGSTIKKVEMYLHNEHFWYNKGGKASIVSHQFSSRPNTFNYYRPITEASFSKGQGRWVILPNRIGEQLRTGEVTGFGLFKNSNELDYYGYFSGATSENRPKLRITFTRNVYESGSGLEFLTNRQIYVEPEYYTHTLQKGESLWDVASKYGVTVAQLRGWNILSGTITQPGARLKIYKESANLSAPATPPQYTTVKTGEGLTQIANRLMKQGLLPWPTNVARTTLMELNGFTSSNPRLYPGDEIMYSRGQ